MSVLLFIIGLCYLSAKVFKNGFTGTNICIFVTTALAWFLVVSIFSTIGRTL